MNKYWVVIMLMLGLGSCSAQNEQYYRLHPQALQQALQLCPKIQPKGMSCQQMEALATQMNSLARELQYSPQAFGNKILKLQETIASQQQELSQKGTNTDLQSNLEQNQQRLTEYMSVVRWLESPES